MALLLTLVASRPHLGWAYGAAAWGVQGLFGGAYVFLATMMASVADWYPPEERGAAFSGLEGSMLLVAAVGPLVGGQVVEHAGFAAAFARSGDASARIFRRVYARKASRSRVSSPPESCSAAMCASVSLSKRSRKVSSERKVIRGVSPSVTAADAATVPR